MDDLTKKKLDSKRLAMSQKHERAYVIRLANELLFDLAMASKTHVKRQIKASTLKRLCEYIIKS